MASVNWCTTLTFFGIITIMIPMSATAQIYMQQCLDDATYAANSSYSNNLNTVLRSFVANATANPTGFFHTSAGSGTNNTVYGVFLCRGDQSTSGCHHCVSTAVREQPEKTDATTDCYQKKAVTMWYDECMIRYDNQPIYGRLSSTNAAEQISSQTDMPGDKASFGELLLKTTRELAGQAANEPSQTGKKYANVAVNFNSFYPLLYCMAQCTPDMSASDCNNCLSMVIGQFPFTLGSRVYHPNCNARYEVHPFLDEDFNSSPPTAPPTTESNTPPSQARHSFFSAPPSQAWPRLPRSNMDVGNSRRKKSWHNKLFVAAITPMAVLILLASGIWICINHKKATAKYRDENRIVESLQFDLNTIRKATCNFALDNKLGEGGFGEVYKGKLESGQEVAIKRLSKNSGQGIVEFKAETILFAKLQHKNLVKLLGFCTASKEKLLVYEFLSNSSLDKILFDPTKNASLSWETRLQILVGIARGLLYLHEDSRLKVIHRDLKTSNILLDEAMNPKISDFGLAKLFAADQTQGDTNRIVGTYGYMAPEYAITGQYSVKSDVYSFGVILLEIVSGQKNKFFGRVQHEEALLHRAWRLWQEGKPLDLVDATMSDNFSADEVDKCIHLGLLCIQDVAVHRPRMRSIVAALSGQAINLPMPKPPSFFGTTDIDDPSILNDQHSLPYIYSGTEIITELHPRS